MPSPFPGMDPWLEGSGHWPNFQNRMITALSDVLVAQVRPAYFVGIEERAWIAQDTATQLMIADVQVTDSDSSVEPFPTAASHDSSTAVAEPVVIPTVIDRTVREPYLEIRDVNGNDVITVIEILSPTNMTSGPGRASYEQKRKAVLESSAHLVEIDLLRGEGSFIPQTITRPRRYQYTVHVSRSYERPDGSVWPITLQQRLPTIPIPLKKDDPDATVDLQAVFADVYDRASLDLVLKYDRPAAIPLDDKDAPWAKTVCDLS